MFPVLSHAIAPLGMILCLLNMSAINCTACDRTLGVQGHRLVVGFDQLAAIAPDHVHDVVVGIGVQPQAQAKTGELGRLLQLLTDLDELVPGLGRLDLGRLENVQAGDQRPGADGLRDAVRLALMHDASQRDREETTGLFMHLVDQVGHLQKMALGAIELRIRRRPPG